MSAVNNNEAAALRYAKRGWPVFPLYSASDGKCCCGKPSCKSPGKHPRTLRGLKEATTSTSAIESWWGRWPDANIGVVTGAASGIVVVDVDPRHGGDVTVEDLDLPETLTAITGGGGTHHVYRHPGFPMANDNNGKIGAGIDFKADGGYIVVDPSMHVNGKRYTWDSDTEDLRDPTVLPQEIIDRLGAAPVSEPDAVSTDGIEYFTESQRHKGLVRWAGTIRDRGADAEEIETLLQVVNEKRCRPPKTRAEVAKIAKDVAARYEPSDPVMPDEDDEPLPLLEPCSPFPVDALPWVLRRIIVAGSTALGVDPLMVALPVLAVCAGAIGSTRRIKIKSSWREFPVIWAIVVSRSGQQKSPAFDLALAPLKKREGVAALDHEDGLLKLRDSRATYDVLLSKWKKEANTAIFPDPPPDEPADPVRRRYYTSDATIEALASLLHDNPRGILLARDELSGWLMGFNAYRQGRGGDEAAWMEMSRGGTLLVDRKSGDRKTIHCENACVSVVGTIQPRMLVRCLRPEYFESGLAARMLMAMPDPRKRIWTDADITEDVIEGYDTVVERLLELDHDPAGNHKPVDLGMTDKARSIFKDFYRENAEEIHGAVDDDYAACLTKIEAYAARLALIIHMIRVADGEVESPIIDVVDITAGVRLARWFAVEAARLYSLFRQDSAEQEAAELVEKIKMLGGSVTVRELTRHSKYRLAKSARAALEDLVGRGWATEKLIPAGDQGGRPSTVYTIVGSADTPVTQP